MMENKRKIDELLTPEVLKKLDTDKGQIQMSRALAWPKALIEYARENGLVLSYMGAMAYVHEELVYAEIVFALNWMDKCAPYWFPEMACPHQQQLLLDLLETKPRLSNNYKIYEDAITPEWGP